MLSEGKIMIVISIPLIRIDQTYEVYKALSVPILPPVPIRSNDRKNSDVIATNNLEATGFLKISLEPDISYLQTQRSLLVVILTLSFVLYKVLYFL